MLQLHADSLATALTPPPFNPPPPARRQYQDFRIGNDGALSGVGMMIASDPDSGKLVVLAPIKGSPAEAAGIQPGDEVGAGGKGWVGAHAAGGGAESVQAQHWGGHGRSSAAPLNPRKHGVWCG